jgi:hypothetical protein
VTPADYAAAKAALVTVRFLDHRVRVVPRFGAKLARVEAALDVEYRRAMIAMPGGVPQPTFAEWHGVRGVGGWRESAGYHGLGRAIDLNYYRNGYLAVRTVLPGGRVVYGGEATKLPMKAARKAFADACDRACMALDGAPADLSARKAGESTGAAWDRFDRASRAVIAYLAPYYPAEDDLDVGEADELPGVTIPAQVAADYQALRVPLVVGSPSLNPRTTRNPAKGLLDIPRHTLVAMDAAGLRIGLCDFGAASSGDGQHIDDASRIASGA